MKLQKKTLQRYRQLFPEETLREISSRTGIQVTRVFRLFNGLNMKVAELEAFEDAIQLKVSENPSYHQLNHALDMAQTLLTNDELAKIAEYISRKVTAKTYSRTYINAAVNNLIIA